MDPKHSTDIQLSIIIVNWNTRDLLLNCLESVFAETDGLNMEVIVVDNASSDDSVDVVRKTFPKVKLIVNSENLGFSKANNIGIGQSSGKYFCLMNSDIEVIGSCLFDMVSYMDNTGSAGLVSPMILNGDRSLRMNCHLFPSLWRMMCRALLLHRAFDKSKLFSAGLMTYFDHMTPAVCDVLPGCFMMVRRSAADEVGLLDEDFFFYGEDKDWCRRFRDKGIDIVYFPGAQAIHFAGKSAEKDRYRFALEKTKSWFIYWRKHHSVLSTIGLRLTLVVMHVIRALGWFCAWLFGRPKRSISIVHVRQHLRCLWWIVSHGAREERL